MKQFCKKISLLLVMVADISIAQEGPLETLLPSKTWGVLSRDIQLVIANQLIKDAVDYMNQLMIPHTIQAHASAIFSVVFSPDGSKVVSASFDGTVKLWDVDNDQLIRTFLHGSDVNFVVFSPDGSRIVSGANDGTIKIWNVDNGELILTFSHGRYVLSVGFNHDGSRIVSGADDGMINLWDVDGKRKQKVFKWFTSVDFHLEQAVIINYAYEAKLRGKKLALKGDGLRWFNKMPDYVRSLLIDYLDIIPPESKSKSD